MSEENNPLENPETPDNGVAPTTNESPEVSEPPKKRRGRPRKNPELNTEEVKSSAKPGPKTGTRTKKTIYGADDISVMGRQLVGIHQIVSMVTGIPEIQIQEQEGVMLAGAIGAVANEYGLEIDGKTGATLQLAMSAAMIYGPRFLMFRDRQKQSRKGNSDNGLSVN